ncbi:potassium voltage-gated channel subfamily C member 1 [Anolis carolinensis]|uniref:potassium voltage-gated channel subfamily C member 1 n=1 Tax=Anolis carolinensis TaxID=28377 RepID=UPI002F2B216D
MADLPEKMVLNVGGVRFETSRSTLRAFPRTKLHSLTEAEASAAFDYDPSAREFFFDRSPRLFRQVLSYCRTRHLHCPADICRSALEEELAFWEITVSQLPNCCWTRLSRMEDPPEDWEDFGEAEEANDSQGLLSQVEGTSRVEGMTHRKLQIWTLLEKPHSSRWAMSLAVLSLLLNIGLIILANVDTTSHFVVFNEAWSHSPEDTQQPFNETSHVPHLHHWAFWHKEATPLLYLELFFILLFACEFVLRLVICPSKKKFLRRPLNVVDFLCLLPVLIELLSAGHPSNNTSLVAWLGLFRIVYVLKLLKVFRLVETPLMLRVLPGLAKAILKEVFLFAVVFVFQVLFFGSLCYYAEMGNPHVHMEEITSGLWWALITLTTVGYGDVCPVTTFGQVVGAITAITGVLSLIVLTAVLIIKLKGFYEAAVAKETRKRTKRQAA